MLAVDHTKLAPPIARPKTSARAGSIRQIGEETHRPCCMACSPRWPTPACAGRGDGIGWSDVTLTGADHGEASLRRTNKSGKDRLVHSAALVPSSSSIAGRIREGYPGLPNRRRICYSKNSKPEVSGTALKRCGLPESASTPSPRLRQLLVMAVGHLHLAANLGHSTRRLPRHLRHLSPAHLQAPPTACHSRSRPHRRR